jgi:hypothetical protein
MARRLLSLRVLLTAAVLLACVAGTEALVAKARPAVNDEGDVQFSGAAIIVRGFAGEIRGLLADFLWLRVDEYQHRRRIVGGDLLRSDDEALMPLVRLITWLNPHFVDAYALGGQWLAFHFDRPIEATAFYEEGIQNNPQSFDLLNGAAWVYWRFRHNNPTAAKRAAEAARVATDDIHKFQALWLEAHILASAGDTPGAIRVWRQVGQIPGYERTAEVWIARLGGSRTSRP